MPFHGFIFGSLACLVNKNEWSDTYIGYKRSAKLLIVLHACFDFNLYFLFKLLFLSVRTPAIIH